jgi:hypothetical protein
LCQKAETVCNSKSHRVGGLSQCYGELPTEVETFLQPAAANPAKHTLCINSTQNGAF